MLNTDTLERYARQLPIIGVDGQQQLYNAHVLLIGAGGLGTPAALYLIAAGIGHLSIFDGDTVELSNLQRQVLFKEADIGQNKARQMKKHLQELNSQCQITAYPQNLNEKTSEEIFKDCSVIVDATDNFYTRYLVNHFSHRFQIPLVSAALFQFEGQLSVFNYQNGPCYQCLYPSPPENNVIPDCTQGGVLGAVAGLLGCLQASEVIKIILHRPVILSGKLLQLNVVHHHYQSYAFHRHPDCSHIHGTIAHAAETSDVSVETISAAALQQALQKKPDEYQLIDVRQDFERKICSLGGLFIPLDRLTECIEKLPHDKILVVYCKKGARSQKAAAVLKQQGYRNVVVLEGGILEWIAKIEPQMQGY